jgi:hypothetical protein
VNRSHRGEAGGVGVLAPLAVLRAVASKAITKLRPTPPQHNRREAGPAVVGPPKPDPHQLTAAAMEAPHAPRASRDDTLPWRGVAGLPHAHTPIALRLRDGDTLPLWIG